MSLSIDQPAGPDQVEDFWPLDPGVTFLNHGSFGSCPRPVRAFQQQLRERMERQPVQFLARDLEQELTTARASLAGFLGAKPDDLVFVPNATAGVNTVLRSLSWAPQDELLVTNHEYNACRNALDYSAKASGAVVVEVPLPFPISTPEEVIARVLERVTSRTRLALLDHVTSQTALVLPIRELVRELAQRGVDTLVDGAHAPGMLDLNINEIGAAYYTGNCHKWLCAPKGAGFLHVREDRQIRVRPLSISHGANSNRTDRSRFQIEFGWTGTTDPTGWLSVPESIRCLENAVVGGWPALRERNHRLACWARKRLCEALEISAPSPDAMLGCMASVPLPPASGSLKPVLSPLYADPLQSTLLAEYGIEVPIIPWPAPPARLVRVSAQLYNRSGQYVKLAEALRSILPG